MYFVLHNNNNHLLDSECIVLKSILTINNLVKINNGMIIIMLLYMRVNLYYDNFIIIYIDMYSYLAYPYSNIIYR